MPQPLPVRPTDADIARDRLRRLGILAFALKTHTDNVRHLLTPREPMTLQELGARAYVLLIQLPEQQRQWWRREWTKLVEDVHRVAFRLRSRV